MENNHEIFEPKVSLFDNVYSKESKREVELRKFLFTKKFKDQVEKYRKSNDEKEREKIKKSLPCIATSGTFTKRAETPISTHTKLICIDIDSKHNPEVNLKAYKNIIGERSPSLYYAGLSIGGKGIFLIFRISNPGFHRQHFDALAFCLNETFSLNVDKTVKSFNSLRVVSYDESPYYNPNPIPFEYIMGIEKRTGQIIRTVAEKDKIREDVRSAMKIIQEKKIDITKGYANWFKIGCALAHEFGEEMREWFHIISYFHEDYYHSDCDDQYSKCLKYREESGVKIATFFYYCKKYGIDW